MKLDKITLQFTSEELEAIHYAIDIGVKSCRKSKSKYPVDWIDKAEEIRKRLPIKLRLLM